jgi:predicted dehydrogenase
MSQRLQLGVIGLVHDHVWHELSEWRATGRVELAAVSEARPELRKRVHDEFGVERVFENTHDMLDACRLDIVQVCTSNAESGNAVVAAAERGIHAVVEKPMSATLEQADRMLAASQQHATQLLINWPFRWRVPTLHAWERVLAGEIGDVFNSHIRMAHKGPREFGCSDAFCEWLYDPIQNGGGALIDYCSYGAVAFRYLFGMPDSVQAVCGNWTKNDIGVEDNAAITLLYPQRHVVTEASWSQIPSYHDSIYYGTQGTLWTDSGQLKLGRSEGDPTEVPVPELPEGFRSGPETMLTCLDREIEPPDVCSPRVARDAQEILQAGLHAAESGMRTKLPWV